MKPDHSIIPERKPHVEPRKNLTRAEFAQLMLDQDGLCGCGCGVKMDAMREGIVDEHMIPLAAGGTNALPNRRLLRKPCAQRKTDEDDKPRIKKARHQAGGAGSQTAKRAKRGKGSIASRGFDKRLRKKMDGTVERRD